MVAHVEMYLACLIAASVFGGLCRTFVNGNYRGLFHAAWVAGLSASLGVFVSLYLFGAPEEMDARYKAVAVAGLVSSAGREVADKALAKVFEKLGLTNGKPKKKTTRE